MHRECRQQKKTEPMIEELSVKLEDIFTGKLVKLSCSRTRICAVCSGKGGKNIQRCSECRGTGIVAKIFQIMPGFISSQQSQCTKCKGQGMAYEKKDECKSCKGERIVQETKTVDVVIEPGIPDGQIINLYGDGNEIVK